MAKAPGSPSAPDDQSASSQSREPLGFPTPASARGPTAEHASTISTQPATTPSNRVPAAPHRILCGCPYPRTARESAHETREGRRRPVFPQAPSTRRPKLVTANRRRRAPGHRKVPSHHRRTAHRSCGGGRASLRRPPPARTVHCSSDGLWSAGCSAVRRRVRRSHCGG
jgi:hypothetical protein